MTPQACTCRPCPECAKRTGRLVRALERIEGYWLANAVAQVIVDHQKVIARRALDRR